MVPANPAGKAPPCAAIVLAAGSSSRMGSPKQLVAFQGEALLRRTARLALELGASPVLVVLGPCETECRAALEGLSVVVVPNPVHATGMGSSLRVGMERLSPAHTLQHNDPGDEADPVSDANRVLLLVCDQPRLELMHLRQLLSAHAPDGIAAASYAGRLGVPAVFDQRHFTALREVTGDQGARALLRALPVTAVPMPEAATDIDTADDLATLTRGADGRH